MSETYGIILPQSLSDQQYLGDTCYHKLSFRHLHLEVSKHRSAWETDVLSCRSDIVVSQRYFSGCCILN